MDKTWRVLIAELVEVGMTQKAIADSIGVTQGAISQVLTGNGQSGFRFEPGRKLRALHRRKTRLPKGEPTSAVSAA